MSVKIDMSGWDDFNRKHEKATARNELSFTELFPDNFVASHTNFRTMQEMLDTSGLDKPDEISGTAWSEFVAGHSRFSGWPAMLEAAYAEWYKTQVGA